MRLDQIEKFISEDGDLDELIIDQDPTHKADHTIHYFYRRSYGECDWHKRNILNKKGVKHDRIR